MIPVKPISKAHTAPSALSALFAVQIIDLVCGVISASLPLFHAPLVRVC